MNEPTTTTRLESGRHPVNIGHLVMGLAFASFVAIWALLTAGAIQDESLRWLMPVPWVLAGAIGLAAVALAGRRRTTPEEPHPTPEEYR